MIYVCSICLADSLRDLGLCVGAGCSGLPRVGLIAFMPVPDPISDPLGFGRHSGGFTITLQPTDTGEEKDIASNVSTRSLICLTAVLQTIQATVLPDPACLLSR